MSEITSLIIWELIRGLISSEKAMILLALAVIAITALMICIIAFTKLGEDYRWVFPTSGLILLSAILYIYIPTISSEFPVWGRVSWQAIGVLWFVMSIGIFIDAVSLRKFSKKRN